ncbi:MAG: hypothetical protein ACLQBX_03670 [Candidatus Limnocylindrales bacterium]|jgi:hypothetical protein
MPTLTLHRPTPEPLGHDAVRMGLPVAGVIAATLVRVAVAAAVHRSAVIKPDSIELVPDASAPDFDEGLEEALAELAAAGIRPTFEVEAELAREIAAELPCEPAREPALSASRA